MRKPLGTKIHYYKKKKKNNSSRLFFLYIYFTDSNNEHFTRKIYKQAQGPCPNVEPGFIFLGELVVRKVGVNF